MSCPLWQSGALVEPSAGTITIYDHSNTVQVSAAAVTITGKIATYSYSPASTLDYGEGWRVEWALTVAGVSVTYINDASLVRRGLEPVVTDQDLFRRHRRLDPNCQNPLSTVSNFQSYIDEAWAEIEERLIALGNRPNLVMSPSAFRPAHLALTLAIIFEDFATSLNETYSDRAETYRGQFRDAWSKLTFTYGSDDDASSPGDSQHRKAATPVIWLCGRAR